MFDFLHRHHPHSHDRPRQKEEKSQALDKEFKHKDNKDVAAISGGAPHSSSLRQSTLIDGSVRDDISQAKTHHPPSHLGSIPEIRRPSERQQRSEKEDGRCLVHRPHLSNTTSALLQRVPLAELRWQLKSASWLTEARTFYLISEAGEVLFIQIAYTNSGWLPAQCQVSASYFDARKAEEALDNGWQTCQKMRRSRSKNDPKRGEDGHVTETVTHPAGKMRISSSKTSFKIGNAEIRVAGPRLDATHAIPQGKLSQENSVPAIKCLYEGKFMTMELTMEMSEDAARFGDGNLTFGDENASDGYIQMVFVPGLRAQGILTIDGQPRDFTAVGMGLHQIQGIRPNQVATRWNTFLFISDAHPTTGYFTILFLIQISTPSSYGGEAVNYGIVHRNDRLLALSWDNQLQTFSPAIDTRSGYYLPQELDLHWQGHTADGVAFTADCHIHPHTLIDRINLLDLLPFVARKIVQTFFTKPYVYQWIDRTQLTLEIEGEERQVVEGWILHEATILNEDPGP